MSTTPNQVLEIDQKLADFMRTWYPDYSWLDEEDGELSPEGFKTYIEQLEDEDEASDIQDFILNTLVNSVRTGPELDNVGLNALLYGWKLAEEIHYSVKIKAALAESAKDIKEFEQDVKTVDDLSHLLPILLTKTGTLKAWETAYLQTFFYEVRSEIFFACIEKFQGNAAVTNPEFLRLQFPEKDLSTFRASIESHTPTFMPSTPVNSLTGYIRRYSRSASKIPDTPAEERNDSNPRILETLFTHNSNPELTDPSSWIGILQVWHLKTKLDFSPIYATLGGPLNDTYQAKLIASEDVDKAIRDYDGNNPNDWQYPGAMAYRAKAFDDILRELDDGEGTEQNDQTQSPYRSSLLSKVSIRAFCHIFRTHPQALWSAVLSPDRLLSDYSPWTTELTTMLDSIEDAAVLKSLRQIAAEALKQHEHHENPNELTALSSLLQSVWSKQTQVTKAKAVAEAQNAKPNLLRVASDYFDQQKKAPEATVEPSVPPISSGSQTSSDSDQPPASPPTRSAQRVLFSADFEHAPIYVAPAPTKNPSVTQSSLGDFEDDNDAPQTPKHRSESKPLLHPSASRDALYRMIQEPSPAPSPVTVTQFPPEHVHPILDAEPNSLVEAIAYCRAYIDTYARKASYLPQEDTARQMSRLETLRNLLNKYPSLFVTTGNDDTLSPHQVAWWVKHAVSDCFEGHRDKLVPMLRTPLNYRFYTLMRVRYPHMDFSALEARYSDARNSRDEYQALSDAYHVATRLSRNSQTPMARWLAQTPKQHAEDWANAISATQLVDRDDGDHWGKHFKEFFQLPVVKYAYKNVKQDIYDHRVIRPELVATWRKTTPTTYLNMFFGKSLSLKQQTSPDLNTIATLALHKVLQDYAGSRFRLVGMVINFIFGHPNRHFAQSVRRYLNAEVANHQQHKDEPLKFEGSWNRLMRQLENDGHLDSTTKKLKHYPDKPGKPGKVYTKPSSLEKRLTFVQELAGALELDRDQVTQLTPRSAAPAA